MTPLVKDKMFPKIRDSDALNKAEDISKKFAIVTPLIKQKIFPKIRDSDALSKTEWFESWPRSDLRGKNK